MIAGPLTEVIVDLLEVAQRNYHHQKQRTVVLHRQADHFLELDAVAQPRQRIQRNLLIL